MFIDNKYLTIYYRLVQRGQSRILLNDFERHHIIPKSLGGSNTPDNITCLTFKEHYICHLLLVKCLKETGKAKRMLSALKMFTRKTVGRKKCFSRDYNLHRKICLANVKNLALSDLHKQRIGDGNRGKPKPPRTAEHRQKIIIAKTGKPKSEEWKAKMREPGKRGHPHSQEAKRLMGVARKGQRTGCKWITNGEISKQLAANQQVPEGWRLGRR